MAPCPAPSQTNTTATEYGTVRLLWGRVFPISFPPPLLQIYSVINRPIRNRSGLIFYRFNLLQRGGAARVSVVTLRDAIRNHANYKGEFIFVHTEWKWLFKIKQECIPVGCVPADRWPYSGVCCSGGVYLVPGGCSWSQGGGCSWSGGCVPGPGGCTWSRGGFVYLVQGEGVYLVPGGCLVRYSPREQNEWQTGVKILPWPKLRFGR